MAAPLPAELSYLESALQTLRSLPADEVNEDIDATELESALRARISGLSIREAQDRLSEDNKALKAWFKESGDPNGSGRWLIAFLSYRPGAMVRSLLAPPAAERPKPAFRGALFVELPVGWSAKSDDPSSLSLWKDGQQVGGIGIIKTTSLGFYRRRYDSMAQSTSPSESWSKTTVRFGECRGDKYSYKRSAPIVFRSVRYLLEVPGGAVEASHGSGPGGQNFDEVAFEHVLKSVRVAEAG
jgi:hypothetical protein